MSAPDGDALDHAVPVRAGEGIDRAALLDYLRACDIGDGDTLTVEQYPRGFSNLTYRVCRGEADCVLRRPPAGAFTGAAHDVVREARLLGALGSAFARVPRVLAICDDPAVLGASFYLMTRAHGIILRDTLPAGLSLDAAGMRRISEGAIDTLAAIHAVDVNAAGLGAVGRPEGYVARQVAGWTRRYAAARTGAQPAVERAAAWLADHLPAEHGATLLHNDFKYDNLVLAPDDPARVVAVLDWEMATVGDPWMDLGTTLAYWVEADDPPALRTLGLGVTALPGNLTRRGVVERYAAVTGRAVESPVFYYAYGLFKVAVIAQQIHARYVAGLTHDPRFAQLDQAVRTLGEAALRAIERGVIGGDGA